MRNILPVAALCFIVLATAPAKAAEYNRSGTIDSCIAIADPLVDEVAKCFDDARSARFRREHRNFCKSYLKGTYRIIDRCKNIIGRCSKRSVEWFLNGSFKRRHSRGDWRGNATCAQ